MTQHLCTSSPLRIGIELRIELLQTERAPSPAVQQSWRARLRQVPALRSWRKSWAGRWVWRALSVTPPGICLSTLTAQHRPSSATWETTPMTTRYCMSYWAWAYPCCLFYKRFCCRCTLRLFLMSRAPCNLYCFGCKSRSGTGSSSFSTGKKLF